ncbi:MAG: CoA transferase [Desulfobacteraceae bacterium]|nr:CoA transferase [Desulfobacteraceae bacterium]
MTTTKDLNKFISAQRSEDKFDHLPLKGLRVIDMATVMAAPFAATLMGDYGADIVKVENPSNPDAIRGWGIIEKAGVSPFWAVVGRNKFPVTLNLKTTEGKRIFTDLITKADVLIENMRPGVMEKLGIGRETLIEENPGLIIGTVSGYGQTGPFSNRPGFGTLAEGFSGFTYLNAQPDGPPTNAPMALADFITGAHLAFAIMICLRGQERGKKGGQIVDMSLYEPLFGMLGPDFLSYFLTGKAPQPKGNELSYVVPRNNYRTKDGKWVTLSGAAQGPFERLMECVGHPEMNADPRFKTNEERIKEGNRQIINQVISDWIGNQDLEEVISTCERLGITIGPIANMEDIGKNPHFLSRGSVIEIEDPASGALLKIPNVPFRLLNSPGKIRFPGLPLGSANAVIYGDLLGYSSEQIEGLKASRAI